MNKYKKQTEYNHLLWRLIKIAFVIGAALMIAGMESIVELTINWWEV